MIDADALGRWYHYETETFDRKHLTGPMGRDGILPANAQERGFSSKHALEIRNHALSMGRERYIPEKDVTKAIQRAAFIPYEQLVAEFGPTKDISFTETKL